MDIRFSAGYGPITRSGAEDRVVLQPWGQWTARLQSPEGVLVSLSSTPGCHQEVGGG